MFNINLQQSGKNNHQDNSKIKEKGKGKNKKASNQVLVEQNRAEKNKRDKESNKEAKEEQAEKQRQAMMSSIFESKEEDILLDVKIIEDELKELEKLDILKDSMIAKQKLELDALVLKLNELRAESSVKEPKKINEVQKKIDEVYERITSLQKKSLQAASLITQNEDNKMEEKQKIEETNEAENQNEIKNKKNRNKKDKKKNKDKNNNTNNNDDNEENNNKEKTEHKEKTEQEIKIEPKIEGNEGVDNVIEIEDQNGINENKHNEVEEKKVEVEQAKDEITEVQNPNEIKENKYNKGEEIKKVEEGMKEYVVIHLDEVIERLDIDGLSFVIYIKPNDSKLIYADLPAEKLNYNAQWKRIKFIFQNNFISQNLDIGIEHLYKYLPGPGIEIKFEFVNIIDLDGMINAINATIGILEEIKKIEIDKVIYTVIGYQENDKIAVVHIAQIPVTEGLSLDNNTTEIDSAIISLNDSIIKLREAFGDSKENQENPGIETEKTKENKIEEQQTEEIIATEKREGTLDIALKEGYYLGSDSYFYSGFYSEIDVTDDIKEINCTNILGKTKDKLVVLIFNFSKDFTFRELNINLDYIFKCFTKIEINFNLFNDVTELLTYKQAKNHITATREILKQIKQKDSEQSVKLFVNFDKIHDILLNHLLINDNQKVYEYLTKPVQDMIWHFNLLLDLMKTKQDKIKKIQILTDQLQQKNDKRIKPQGIAKENSVVQYIIPNDEEGYQYDIRIDKKDPRTQIKYRHANPGSNTYIGPDYVYENKCIVFIFGKNFESKEIDINLVYLFTHFTNLTIRFDLLEFLSQFNKENVLINSAERITNIIKVIKEVLEEIEVASELEKSFIELELLHTHFVDKIFDKIYSNTAQFCLKGTNSSLSKRCYTDNEGTVPKRIIKHLGILLDSIATNQALSNKPQQEIKDGDTLVVNINTKNYIFLGGLIKRVCYNEQEEQFIPEEFIFCFDEDFKSKKIDIKIEIIHQCFHDAIVKFTLLRIAESNATTEDILNAIDVTKDAIDVNEEIYEQLTTLVIIINYTETIEALQKRKLINEEFTTTYNPYDKDVTRGDTIKFLEELSFRIRSQTGYGSQAEKIMGSQPNEVVVEDVIASNEVLKAIESNEGKKDEYKIKTNEVLEAEVKSNEEGVEVSEAESNKRVPEIKASEAEVESKEKGVEEEIIEKRSDEGEVREERAERPVRVNFKNIFITLDDNLWPTMLISGGDNTISYADSAEHKPEHDYQSKYISFKFDKGFGSTELDIDIYTLYKRLPGIGIEFLFDEIQDSGNILNAIYATINACKKIQEYETENEIGSKSKISLEFSPISSVFNKNFTSSSNTIVFLEELLKLLSYTEQPEEIKEVEDEIEEGINKPVAVEGINKPVAVEVDLIEASERNDGQVIIPITNGDSIIVYKNSPVEANNHDKRPEIIAFEFQEDFISNKLDIDIAALYKIIPKIPILFGLFKIKEPDIMINAINATIDACKKIAKYEKYNEEQFKLYISWFGSPDRFNNYFSNSDNAIIFLKKLLKFFTPYTIKTEEIKKDKIEEYGYSEGDTTVDFKKLIQVLENKNSLNILLIPDARKVIYTGLPKRKLIYPDNKLAIYPDNKLAYNQKTIEFGFSEDFTSNELDIDIDNLYKHLPGIGIDFMFCEITELQNMINPVKATIDACKKIEKYRKKKKIEIMLSIGINRNLYNFLEYPDQEIFCGLKTVHYDNGISVVKGVTIGFLYNLLVAVEKHLYNLLVAVEKQNAKIDKDSEESILKSVIRYQGEPPRTGIEEEENAETRFGKLDKTKLPGDEGDLRGDKEDSQEITQRFKELLNKVKLPGDEEDSSEIKLAEGPEFYENRGEETVEYSDSLQINNRYTGLYEINNRLYEIDNRNIVGDKNEELYKGDFKRKSNSTSNIFDPNGNGQSSKGHEEERKKYNMIHKEEKSVYEDPNKGIKVNEGQPNGNGSTIDSEKLSNQPESGSKGNGESSNQPKTGSNEGLASELKEKLSSQPNGDGESSTQPKTESNGGQAGGPEIPKKEQPESGSNDNGESSKEQPPKANEKPFHKPNTGSNGEPSSELEEKPSNQPQGEPNGNEKLFNKPKTESNGGQAGEVEGVSSESDSGSENSSGDEKSVSNSIKSDSKSNKSGKLSNKSGGVSNKSQSGSQGKSPEKSSGLTTFVIILVIIAVLLLVGARTNKDFKDKCMNIINITLQTIKKVLKKIKKKTIKILDKVSKILNRALGKKSSKTPANNNIDTPVNNNINN